MNNDRRSELTKQIERLKSQRKSASFFKWCKEKINAPVHDFLKVLLSKILSNGIFRVVYVYALFNIYVFIGIIFIAYLNSKEKFERKINAEIDAQIQSLSLELQKM